MAAKPASILIVDDEFSVRDSLYRWFCRDGYEVTAVPNAAEALKAIQDHKFEVALVDILRVLETKELTRIGGTRPIQVDFRVIGATNDNLERAVAEGRFREDLYYRINIFTIELPPLRERRSDIPALARHFLGRFARQMDKRITDISPEAMDLLAACDWPGNVRELSNAIERAMVVGTPPAIRPEDLPLRRPANNELTTGESLGEMEKRHISAMLERTGGNITRAAEILKVDRGTVYNKIKKYGLRA